MPFYRRTRRFSATPRRRWFRPRMSTSSVREGRMQVAQGYFQIQMENDFTGADPFQIVNLTPWTNGPDGGFDRSWVLKGILWDMRVTMLGHDVGAGTIFEVVPQGSLNLASQLLPVASAFYVDATDPDTEAPVTALSATDAFSPFLTTPPIGSPTTSPNDDKVFPVRVLKTKLGSVALGRSQDDTAPFNVGQSGITVMQWSGRIGRRLNVGNRQGLFCGLFATTPVGGPPTNVESVSVLWTFWCKYYYRLAR